MTVGLPPVGLRGSFVLAAGLSDYLPILLMGVLAVAFAVASLGASALLDRIVPTVRSSRRMRAATIRCGSRAGSASA